MEDTLKLRYKEEFKRELDRLLDRLREHVSYEDGEWTIKGFIDIYKNIYTISADTKIVSKILEIHIFPLLLEFAEHAGYKLVLAEKQNWYPDLTFIRSDDDEAKFAVDIKTTFRRDPTTVGFTLGSHGSYFREREKSKNIQFPYSQYIGHYCLGIIYSRNDSHDSLAETEVVDVADLEEKGENTSPPIITERQVTRVENLRAITSVIRSFDFFAEEKWKIASDRQGSGNTANIGSISDVEDLKNGRGIFSRLGEEWFDEYWINYGLMTTVKNGKTIKITNLRDYLEFKGRPDLIPLMGRETERHDLLTLWSDIVDEVDE